MCMTNERNKRWNKYQEIGDENTWKGREKTKKTMINIHQYNERKSYHQWWNGGEDNDLETLVKDYSR